MHKLVGALVAAMLVFSASPVRANQYEIFIDVEKEEDLYDLFASQQISETSFNTLLELFQRGVNLNTATRARLYTLPNLTYADADAILAFRKEVGFIGNPAELALRKIISKRKFIAIAAFLVIRDRKRRIFDTTGRIRAQTVWTTEDARIPATALLVRIQTLKHLSIGVLGVISRNRIGSPVYDPFRDALIADGPSTRPEIPKFYAQWNDDKVNIIVGNFTAGFGERLVFDTTPLPTPNGIYPDDTHRRTTDLTRECKLSTGERGSPECQATRRYVTPDFKWSDYSMGVAIGIKNLKVGSGQAQAYGFVSFRTIDVYQYQLYAPDRCTDPNDESDECKAPAVFERQDNPTSPSDKISYQTLPNVMRELLVGGNIAYRPQRRLQFGITGYGSTTRSLTGGLDLDWQEWASRPYGGAFGALGINAAVGRKWFDLFVEVAHSFDSMENGGGGLAGVARLVASKRKEELEVSFRYFDRKFANPFGGAYAQPDTLDGRRDRDEVGGRVRYTSILSKKLYLRASADLWTRPALQNRLKTELRLRADVKASKIFGYGLWLEHDNRDIGKGGLACDNDPEELANRDFDDRSSAGDICGRSFSAIGRIFYSPHKNWRISGQYKQAWIEDKDSTRGTFWRKDRSVWATLFAKPHKQLGIRARVRYNYQDIDDNTKDEQSIWFYVNFRFLVAKRQWFHIRYDMRKLLDERTNTADRLPQTESWVWAQYEAKF